MDKKLNILIAPLDWGLGHATRCIPIIKNLQPFANIFIAVNNKQKSLLQSEFTNVAFIPFPGYNIRYATNKRFFAWKILSQLPKVFLQILKEPFTLKKLVRNYAIDVVISDNRFGFYNAHTYNVFITHQLNIKASSRLLEKLMRIINYSFINRFDECWIPDYQGKINLAGSLSHPPKMPEVPCYYLGPLSRFINMGPSEKSFDWLFLLSGPEPQRTKLESFIKLLHPHLPGKKILIRGVPELNTEPFFDGDLIVLNHASGKELNRILIDSDVIISRSGYTTIMELISLNKKALLIPTPGQTEQVYLSNHLAGLNRFLCIDQNNDISTTKEKLMQLKNMDAPKQFFYEEPDLALFLKEFIRRYFLQNRQ